VGFPMEPSDAKLQVARGGRGGGGGGLVVGDI